DSGGGAVADRALHPRSGGRCRRRARGPPLPRRAGPPRRYPRLRARSAIGARVAVRSGLRLVEPARRRPGEAADPRVRGRLLVEPRRGLARAARLREGRRSRWWVRGVAVRRPAGRARAAARGGLIRNGWTAVSVQIDRDRLVDTATQMINVHSFTGDEERMAELMLS